MNSFFQSFPTIQQRVVSSVVFHVLGIKNEIEMILQNTQITKEQGEEITRKLEKVQSGTPVEYVLGECEFLGSHFFVNDSVLIPRVDTESIVHYIYELGKKNAHLKILDLCTGSGCIGISLAKHYHNSTVTMVDISPQALEVCAKNAKHHNVEMRTTIIQKDILHEHGIPFDDFDIIVSNPPYIRTDVIPTLESSVRENEPLLALDGGEDGLKFYRKLVGDCKKYYGDDSSRGTKKTACVFEIGYDQAGHIKEILLANGIKKFEIIKDLTGNDRGVFFEI